MPLPQPFQYQGSKRALASLILRYLPENMTRLVEPFCGSAAVSIAAAARGRVKEFWLNDFNKPLADLLGRMINSPKELAKSYADLWRADHEDALEHYYQVRESFNRNHDARLLLYLLARCVKGAVRYNGDGLFNQSPDKRRLGTRPETMKENIAAISALLRGRSIVTSQSYEDVLANVRPADVVCRSDQETIPAVQRAHRSVQENQRAIDSEIRLPLFHLSGKDGGGRFAD